MNAPAVSMGGERDLAAVAGLHCIAFAGRFLGSLPPGLLRAYYACLLAAGARLVVARRGEALAGFALGGPAGALAAARRRFVSRHGWALALSVALRPRLWARALRRLRARPGAAPAGPEYRLLSLAVAPAEMGGPAAAALLAGFEAGLPARAYGCSVRADNPRALAFYRRAGFVELGREGGSVQLARSLRKG